MTMNVGDIKQLERNFKEHNYAFFINTKIESAHTLYTNPLGLFNESPDEKVDIQSRLVDKIEKDEGRSFVVLGDAGSGKTSLALHLCNEYWKKVSLESDEINGNFYVPIYIPLRQVELQKDCKNILSTFCEISPGNIRAANLSNWNLLLFLDGYDELAERINLWEHNNWWLPERRKKIKTVTLCRSIGLTVSERELCFTFGYSEKSEFISIQAFESVQIDDYLRKTVAFLRKLSIDDENVKNDPWLMTKKVTASFTVWENDVTEYEKWFRTTFPDLKKLGGNPYLLTIILQILPGIVEGCKKSVNGLSDNEQEKAIRVRCSTEIGIYDEFVAQWFRYQATKIRKAKSNPEFVEIPIEHIAGFMLAYAQNLAFSSAQKNRGFLGDGAISEEDSLLWYLWKPIHNKELLELVDVDGKSADPKYWKLFPKDQHDNDDGRISNFKSLRNACFLSNPTAGTFKFFHSSLVEYFASREVFESVRGRFNFYLSSDDPIYDNEFGINVSNLTDRVHYPLLKNLAERAQTNESFKNLLFEIIDKSSEILILSLMSANAMTILNFAGICLSGRSFQNVQVPGANLSGSNLANSNFQFANLCGVNLQQSWMVGCKFQGANFDKVNFGQRGSVNLGSVDVVGIVEDGKNNLVISHVNGKVLRYSYGTEIVREIECRADERKHFMYIEGDVLLIHELSFHEKTVSALYEFAPLPVHLMVNLWNLNLNEKMDSINLSSPIPMLNSTEHWISREILEDRSDEQFKEIVSNRSVGNAVFYNYEIKSCQKGKVGLVLLWGYMIKQNDVTEYREPQILTTFQVMTSEVDRTLLRFNSDFPIVGCDIYANKLVAVRCVNFVVIFSIFPVETLIFKDNFPIDSDYSDREDIKFSSNGQYLVYKSDFVYLCSILDVKVISTIKLLEVDPENITNFFVVFDKSCEMAAFSYDDTVFVCKLPAGTIIQKMYIQDGLVWSLFPTFSFIDQIKEISENQGKLFCYMYGSSNRNTLETIEISEAKDSVSHQKIKELGKFCVSSDNRRVATCYTISGKRDRNLIKKNILSVFDTPIRPQTLLFQQEIESKIYKMIFTQNYLLVMVHAEVLVMDMNGKTHQSIKFPTKLNLTTFISSKYQQIVLCSRGEGVEGGSETLQLCKIVEVGTDNNCRMARVAFEKQYSSLRIMNILVGNIIFDSKNGSHILLEHISNRENVWLWVPAENTCLKISKDGMPEHISVGFTTAFFMLDDVRRACFASRFGYYFISISSDDSSKLPKNKFGPYHDYQNIASRFYLNWFVHVNSNGKLFIRTLKNDDLLSEFLFPHRVENFNFDFAYNSQGDILETVNILTWDLDGNISSLVIDDINFRIGDDSPNPAMLQNWKMIWTVKSNSVLNFQNSIIAKTFKVNESNRRLLTNFNMNSDVGEPWPEKIEYFSLSELYSPITEIETKYAIINTENSGGPRMPVMSDMWVVSVIARNSKSNARNTVHIEHVGLLIEGINNGRHFAMEAELTANKNKGFVRIKLFPVTQMTRLDQLKSEYIARQWMRPKSDVQMLIRSIQNDQLVADRKYNLLRNNCASWCIEKLKDIGIKKDRKKWYRKIILADLPSDLFRIKGRIVKNRLPFNISKSA